MRTRRQKFVATEVIDPDEHARLYALAEGIYTDYGDCTRRHHLWDVRSRCFG